MNKKEDGTAYDHIFGTSGILEPNTGCISMRSLNAAFKFVKTTTRTWS